MQDPQQPSLPKPRSVEGVDADVISDIAHQLIGKRLERIFASILEPKTFKPHERPEQPTQ